MIKREEREYCTPILKMPSRSRVPSVVYESTHMRFILHILCSYGHVTLHFEFQRSILQVALLLWYTCILLYLCSGNGRHKSCCCWHVTIIRSHYHTDACTVHFLSSLPSLHLGTWRMVCCSEKPWTILSWSTMAWSYSTRLTRERWPRTSWWGSSKRWGVGYSGMAV